MQQYSPPPYIPIIFPAAPPHISPSYLRTQYASVWCRSFKLNKSQPSKLSSREYPLPLLWALLYCLTIFITGGRNLDLYRGQRVFFFFADIWKNTICTLFFDWSITKDPSLSKSLKTLSWMLISGLRVFNFSNKHIKKRFRGCPHFGPSKGSASKNECPITAHDPTFLVQDGLLCLSPTNCPTRGGLGPHAMFCEHRQSLEGMYPKKRTHLQI